MSKITTHVLDTGLGQPGREIVVRLAHLNTDREWDALAEGVTDDDGRVTDLLPESADLQPGTYKLTFETAAYHAELGEETFYPYVAIPFEVTDITAHYHVPLLLNRFGYTTYRGS